MSQRIVVLGFFSPEPGSNTPILLSSMSSPDFYEILPADGLDSINLLGDGNLTPPISIYNTSIASSVITISGLPLGLVAMSVNSMLMYSKLFVMSFISIIGHSIRGCSHFIIYCITFYGHLRSPSPSVINFTNIYCIQKKSPKRDGIIICVINTCTYLSTQTTNP